MTIQRRPIQRRWALSGAAALLTAAAIAPAAAQSADETALAKAVEEFRVAMHKADKAAFERLCAPGLSYGHSAGRIETKAEFIAASTSGQSTWKTIDFNDRTAKVAGANGISRFMLVGQTESQGKTTDIKIGVLMVWVKEAAGWQLLARQAFRV